MLKQLPPQFDATGVEVSQGMATSKDGTSIPYFLLRPPSPSGKVGEPQPTLLYAYGGFEISQTPGYISTVGAGWLERGGAYVVANIRGGGELRFNLSNSIDFPVPDGRCNSCRLHRRLLLSFGVLRCVLRRCCWSQVSLVRPGTRAH